MFACLCAVFLTHSRGPLLGLAVALGVTLLLNFRWYYLLGILVIGLSILGYDYVTDGGVKALIARSDAGRFWIYNQLYNRVEGFEWFGLGLGADSSVPLGHEVNIYCHSTFLCSYYHGGYVGLFLHLAMILTFVFWAWQHFLKTGSSLYLSFLAFGIFCYLIDGGRLLYHPRTEWLLIWWPIALLIIEKRKEQNATVIAN